MVDCSEIGIDKNSEYPNHTNIQFESLTEYLKIAEKATRYFIKRLKPDMFNKVINNEDVISMVAYAIMIADWKWKEDGGRTKRSYRNDHACYALRSYIRRCINGNSEVLSLDQKRHGEDLCLYDLIKDNRVVNSVNNDFNDNLGKIQRVLDSGKLTERQFRCISEYYVNGKTYKEIGDEIGVTKERIRQNLETAKERIRELV